MFADKLTTLEDRAAFLKELDHQTAVLGRGVLSAPQVTQFSGGGVIQGFGIDYCGRML